MHKIRKVGGALKILFKSYKTAWKRGELKPTLLFHLRELVEGIERLGQRGSERPLSPLDQELCSKFKKEGSLLHPALQERLPLSFSALMPVYKPNPEFLRKALVSVLEQSAPNLELLVGFDGPQPPAVIQTVEELQKKFPGKIRSFSYEWGGISETTNKLAQEATGSHLLLVDHDDWIAPDLLLKYHQKLLQIENLKDTYLYCDEYKIDTKDRVVPHSLYQKEESPPFPFVLFNQVTHALLVPKALFEKVEGLRSETDGAQDFDLILRLDLVGAKGKNIPLPLYAWRVHPQSTTSNPLQKPEAHFRSLKALNDYQQKKGLGWHYEEGLTPLRYRALPPLKKRPKVEVFLRHDQKIIESLKKQQGVDLVYTFLPESGLLSRHLNQAIKLSSSELILLLNDVELKETTAIEEMVRFAEQKEIGLVSCRLESPTGALLHSGYQFRKGNWAPPPERFLAYVQRVVDGVTADCCLLRRELYESVGGIDDLLYPDEGKEFNLSQKLKDKGYFAFYTPHASGIKHSST